RHRVRAVHTRLAEGGLRRRAEGGLASPGPAPKGAPTLASAVASSGANLGISIGAYLGGLTMDAGLGYTSPSWVGAGMALRAVAVTAWSGMLDNRAGRTPPSRSPPAIAPRPGHETGRAHRSPGSPSAPTARSGRTDEKTPGHRR